MYGKVKGRTLLLHVIDESTSLCIPLQFAKMRFSLLVAVICGALVLAHYEADASYTVARTVHNMKSFRIASAHIRRSRRSVPVTEGVRSSRVKRQLNPACTSALTQAVTNTTFTTCSRFLENIENFGDLSTQQIESFCQTHCPMVLHHIYGRIQMACKGSGQNFVPPEVCLPAPPMSIFARTKRTRVTVRYVNLRTRTLNPNVIFCLYFQLQQYLELLNQSCHHSAQDPSHYCLEDWVKVNKSLSPSDLAIYEVSEYSHDVFRYYCLHAVCTSHCRTVLMVQRHPRTALMLADRLVQLAGEPF